MRGLHDGEKNPFYGKKHTPDQLKRMAEAHKGKCPTQETREKLREAQRQLGTPVRCVETGITYRSIIEAAEATGIPYNCLKGVIKGDRHSTCGTHWERVQ